MATSGTYSFGPAASELMLNAWARIHIRRSELTQQHLQDAAMESNLVQVQFSNRQPLWWKSEELTYVLTPDDGVIDLPPRVVTIIAAYIATTSDDQVTDRIISQISTYDYAAISNKLTPTGLPTVFKFERLLTPQVTLWQVPDDTQTYTLKLRVLSQPEDVVLPNGINVDSPYRFLDAFTAELAYRLARIYKPDLEQRRQMDAKMAWDLAANQDQESVPVYISPGIAHYYR